MYFPKPDGTYDTVRMTFQLSLITINLIHIFEMVTAGEKALVVITSLVIAAGAIMAALVGLILPKSFLRNEDAVEAPYAKLEQVSTWIRERNSGRTAPSINKYKWLVSINLPLYQDAKQYVYACSGAVIGKDLVLTGKGCITNAKRFQLQDFYKAIVRSNSEYYSYGGQTHSVQEFSYPYGDELFNQLIHLRVKPDFSNEMIIKTANKFEDTTLEAVGWGGIRVSSNFVIREERYLYQHIRKVPSFSSKRQLDHYCDNKSRLKSNSFF